MPPAHTLTLREELRRTVRLLPPEAMVYAEPPSTQWPVLGYAVETADLCIAVRTQTEDVVWVHAEDCPDLVEDAVRASRL